MKLAPIAVMLLVFLFLISCTKSEPSLADYPNMFIRNGQFTARIVVPSSASGIVTGVDFAAAIQYLNYTSNGSLIFSEYLEPLMLLSEETNVSDMSGRLIKDQDLVVVGDPCEGEPELLAERYSCSEWEQKPQSFEFFLEQKGESKRLYVILRNSEKYCVNSDWNCTSSWRFVSNYLSLKEKFPTNELRICFSKDHKQVACR